MKTDSTLARSFPTFWHYTKPIRWAVGTRRQRWTLAAVLLAIAAAPVLWWSLQLAGLPDVGEPFDVEGFRSARIPEDRNAYVLYMQATRKLKDEKPRHGHDPRFWDGWLVPWSKAGPEIRHEVEEERAALALYREAADRPDSWPLPALDTLEIEPALPQFHMMAMLEASRLEDQGEMAAAWGWYRAVLRSLHHQSRCVGFGWRQVVLRWHDELRRRLAVWSADPRTTPADLHRALDDALACESIAPSDSNDLKRAYLGLLRDLEDGPHDFRAKVSTRKWQALFGATDQYLHPDRMQQIYDLWRAWTREPERRRRIVRLVAANWLAYVDLPPARRPRPELTLTGPYEFFTFGPEAPAAARALSPAALDRWLHSSLEAKQRLDDWMGWWSFRINGKWMEHLSAKEKAAHKALVILLASRLYRRDHGSDPPSTEALVGPYLRDLPDTVDDGSEQAMPEAGKPLQ